MKCISRSTLGVVFGILNNVVYLVASIWCIINVVGVNAFVRSDRTGDQDDIVNFGPPDEILYMPHGEETENDYVITGGSPMPYIILTVCLIMVLISSLLTVDIVKKRHSLMAPWITLSLIGFFLTKAFLAAIPFDAVLYAYANVCSTLGIEALILYLIFTLYRDIRNKNSDRPGQTIAAGNVEFTKA